jgi:hypothetical protein
MSDYSEHLISQAGGDGEPAKPFIDVDPVSVYEVGSVQFLNGLQALDAWIYPGVPVSGDRTLLHRNGVTP